MVNDWFDFSLGEILDITSSKRIFRSDYCESGVPFYRSKEIIEKSKGNNISTELFISEDKFEALKNKFGAPEPGDILLTSVGTLGVPY
ncbi:restriction endonuclease subunit S, partial [Psychrobacter sp. AOP29-E1-7]